MKLEPYSLKIGIPSVLKFVAVALVAGAVSLSRLLVENSNALSNLVWAEDGLFPLCIKSQGYFSCLVDPFAGYFLFLSRTLALPVVIFDMSMWPLITNLVAAISIGLGVGLIYWLLVRAGVGEIASAIAGLTAVFLPIVGFEAINASGSAYMVLLIAAAISVSFNFNPPLRVWVVPLVLLITSLTIPSSIVLLLPLLFRALLDRASRHRRVAEILALSLGLGVQATTALAAENARQIEVTFSSLGEWISQLPVALGTLLPGLVTLSDSGSLDSETVNTNLIFGLLFLFLLAMAVVILLRTRKNSYVGSAWVLTTGFLMGLIPALAGYSNNRYFVVPLIASMVALIVVLDSIISWHRKLIMSLIGIAGLVLWLPNYGASAIRSNAMPPWDQMFSDVLSGCESEPNSNARLVFTPDWPFADAVFLGPTTNIVSCSLLMRD